MAESKTYTVNLKSKSTGETVKIPVQAASPKEAQEKALLIHKARERLGAEDAQRGPIGSAFKSFSDSTANIASNLPFIGGLVDEGTAGLKTALQGGNYDENLAYERERMAQFNQRAPNAVKGANMIPGLYAGYRVMPGALPGGPIVKTLAGGTVGGASGAVEGYTRGEGGVEQRLESAKGGAEWGAGLGAASVPGAAILGGIVQMATKQLQRLPTTKEIHDLARAGYKQAEDAGLQYTQQAWQAIVDNVTQAVKSYGIGGPMGHITKRANPVTARIVQDMQQTARAGTPAPLEAVEQIKQVTGNMPAEPAAQAVSREVKSAIDTSRDPDFLPSPNIDAGLEGIHQGRENWSRYKRAERFDKAKYDAELDAGSKFTQAGYEHAIRAQLKKLAKEEDFLTWPKAEQDAVKEVIGGGTVTNFFRKIGGMSITSGPMMAMLNTLALAGGVPKSLMAPFVLATGGSRVLARTRTTRAAEMAEALIKSGKPQGPTPQAQQARRTAQKLMLGASGTGGEALNRRFGH